MANPTCDVCGRECKPATLHGMNVGDVGRKQTELLNRHLLAELADGKRLTACQEPGSNWLWIHPTDADEPRHRDRNLSNGQVESLADGIGDALRPNDDEPTSAEEACARAEIEAEGRLDERRERHFGRHGHFGPGHDPGPD